MAHTFKPGRQRQEDLWEYEASHAYTSSSMPAKDAQWNSVSNNEIKIQVKTNKILVSIEEFDHLEVYMSKLLSWLAITSTTEKLNKLLENVSETRLK